MHRPARRQCLRQSLEQLMTLPLVLVSTPFGIHVAESAAMLKLACQQPWYAPAYREKDAAEARGYVAGNGKAASRVCRACHAGPRRRDQPYRRSNGNRARCGQVKMVKVQHGSHAPSSAHREPLTEPV